MTLFSPGYPRNADFKKAYAVAPFVYNWALAEWQRQYEAHKANLELPKPSETALRRQLNAIKREHKLTAELTCRYHTIVIEDLNVNGMVRNHRLAFPQEDLLRTLAFNTLEFAKKLKAANFTQDQAEALAEAVAGIVEERLATKQNLKDLEVRLDI